MKKVVKLIPVLMLVMLLFPACKPGSVGAADYMQKIGTEPSLNKTVVIGNIRYTFHLLTPEAVALQYSLNEGGQVDLAKYNKRLAEVKDNIYVNIAHQVDQGKQPVLQYNLADPSVYEQRVMYYEFEARKDLKMMCGGNEISSIAYLYENHVSLSPQNNIIATFPKCSQSDDMQVLFNDRAFNNLFIKVSFSQKDINQLPQLVLN
jgi:hypothetical protein